MPDPLSIIGGVASIIQIAEALTHLSSQFRRCLHTVRYAPQEVRTFHRDLSNFSASLRWFYEISSSCLKELEKSPEKKERRKHIAGVIKECEVVEAGFDSLLRKFVRSSSRLPSISSPVDRIRWYFRKPSVVGLRLSLESAKSTVELFMTLYICESLQRKIHELQDASKEIPEELKRRLHSLEQQLKQQAQSTEDSHKRLIEHLEKIPYSAPMLIPGMRSILNETRTLEQNATRSLRKEGRRIRQEISSPSQSRYPRRRSPSPEPHFIAQGPRGPRSPPPDPNVVGIHSIQPIDPAIENVTNIRPRRSSTVSRHSNPSNSKTSEISPIVQITPLHSRPSFEVERSPVSPLASVLPEPKIYGSIIRDDGNDIREPFGEWRPEASELLHQSESPAPSTVIPALLSSRRPSQQDTTVRGVSPDPERPNSVERKGIVQVQVEAIEGGQRSSIGGSSPYKAMPPFLDEDWKGIRRRPSQ